MDQYIFKIKDIMNFVNYFLKKIFIYSLKKINSFKNKYYYFKYINSKFIN